MSKVFVVTNPEAGWDCVRGVYSSKRQALEDKLDDEDYDVSNKTDAELEERLDEKGYILHDTSLDIEMNSQLVEDVLKPFAKYFLKVCKEQGWERNWSNGGCYLHLEVSEFIEALRGKGKIPDEAGDVFFVFLAMLLEHKISIKQSMDAAVHKVDNIDTHPNILNKDIKHTDNRIKE